MGENSAIEWTDHTFNPWIGCTRVSPGCVNCYAEELMDRRYGRVKWGPQGARSRTSVANWRWPLAWDRRAEAEGRRYKVFCASLADVFEDRPDLDAWRLDLMILISQTPHLDWLLLTKRPENVLPMTDPLWYHGFPANVWIGASVENQELADKRIPVLQAIPAPVIFLSVEPMIGPIDLSARPGNNWPGVDWVIVGGESGPHRRPFDLEWARAIRDQCAAAGVPFFMKQVDKVQPIPADLMIRQFPEVTI